MLDKGKLVPNWKMVDHEGHAAALWDFRQKSHLVLIYDPEAKKERQKQWLAAVHLDHKQWEWLQAKILILREAPADVSPGIYLIDRYGLFLNYFPLDHWNFDDLEREFVYYEARHC
jgi:hypothetical protein